MKYCLDGDYEISTDTHELLHKGQVQKIEPLVFKLLTFMLENSNRVLSHDELINAVWKTSVISNSALNAAISAARHAIGDTGQKQQCIKTVSGSGYRFIAGFKRINDRETNSSEFAIVDFMDVSASPESTNASQAQLRFAVIRLDSSEINWAESPTPKIPILFNQKYSQFFKLVEFVTDADPVFDITIKNELQSPIILNKIGIELVDTAHKPLLRGIGISIPETAKIKLVDTYVIEIPDICNEFPCDDSFNSIEPIKLQRDIVIPLPDPIFFEGNAAYRYSVSLKNYSRHIPHRTLIRFIAESDQGRIHSHLIRIEQ